MNEEPEQVIYGNAANSSKIANIRKQDEELEQNNYKRITYTKEEKKKMKKKIERIQREDMFDDGIKEIQQIMKLNDTLFKKQKDDEVHEFKEYKAK